MREIRYYCENCEYTYDTVDELEVRVVIDGEFDVMCCPNCQSSIEIIVEKQ